MEKLSKKKVREVWFELFRPKCFGGKDSLLECITRYYHKSTVERKVLPCVFYDRCLTEALRRQRLKAELKREKWLKKFEG